MFVDEGSVSPIVDANVKTERRQECRSGTQECVRQCAQHGQNLIG
jgi:hypothetical protein